MSDLATISKWGNSQGIRLPKSFCDQLGIAVGDRVDISLENDQIVIKPMVGRYTLKARLQSWDGTPVDTPEFDWGIPMGKEIW